MKTIHVLLILTLWYGSSLFNVPSAMAAVEDGPDAVLSQCSCNLKDALKGGDWQKAAQSAEKLIAASPSSEEAKDAYLWLGLYQKSHYDFGKSTQYYQKAAQLFPNTWTSAEATARMGCNYYKQNNYNKALEFFHKAGAEAKTWQQKKYASAWAKWVHFALAEQEEQLTINCATKSFDYYLNSKEIGFDKNKLASSLTLKDGLVPLSEIVKYFKAENVKLKAVKCPLKKLNELNLPVVAAVKPSHLIVVNSIEKDKNGKLQKIRVYDPVIGEVSYYESELANIWTGKIVTISAPLIWELFASVPKKDLDDVLLGACYCCPQDTIPDCDEDSDECCNRAGTGPGGPGDPGCGGFRGCKASGFGFPKITVDTSSLALVIRDTPIGYTTALGEDIKITLTFNSDLSHSGIFGNGWHSNLETRIQENPDNSVIVRRSGGHDSTFTYSGGQYNPPIGNSNDLIKNPDGTFALVFTKSHRIYHYDTHANGGKLLGIEDHQGHTVTYEYDINGNIDSITDAVGRVTDITTDGAGRITGVMDPLGRQAAFVYDPNSNLVEVEDMAGNVFTYTYDTNNNIISLAEPKGTYRIQYGQWSYEIWVSTITDPENNSYHYGGERPTYVADPKWNYTQYYADWTWPYYMDTVKITDALGNYVQNTYDSNRNKTAIRDKRGNITVYTYDSNRNITSQTDPLQNRWLYTYDANNNLVRSIDPKGRTTLYEYDYNDNLLSVTEKEDPNAITSLSVVSYTYHTNGLVASVNSNGNTTTYDYDEEGNLIQITDPEPNVTTFTYDDIGRKLTMTNAANAVTRYEYDDLNRITKVIHPDLTYIEYTYDCCGLSQVRDENGKITSYQYDSLGRRTKVSDAEGNETTYVYDSVGNLTSLTDAKGNTTTYTYDVLNRVTKITYPLGGSESYTYDQEGNILKKTDGKGHRTLYTYDKNNRVIQVQY